MKLAEEYYDIRWHGQATCELLEGWVFSQASLDETSFLRCSPIRRKEAPSKYAGTMYWRI
jgi:hypothetical protein